MKRVRFDPVVHYALTEEEWAEFLNSCEIDIDQDLAVVKDTVGRIIEKQQKQIVKTRNRIETADPTDTRYITKCRKAISNFKMKIHYLSQMVMKIQECRELYEMLLNVYTLPSHNKKEVHETEEMFDAESMSAEKAEQLLLDEYYMEMQQIDEGSVPSILSATKKFFMIQLTKVILFRRRKFEKEEDIIIQILGNIATANEYYKNALN